MADEVYTFDLASMKKLAAAYRRLERQVQDLRAVVQTQPRGDRGADAYLVKPVDPIDREDSGKAAIGRIDHQGNPVEMGPTETLWNPLERPLVKRWQLAHKERGSTRYVVGHPGPSSFVGYTAGGISARSGLTPGSGQVSVFRFLAGTLVLAGDSAGNPITDTVYNLHHEICGNRFVLCDLDWYGTAWVSNQRPQRLYKFELEEDMNYLATGQTLATISDFDGSDVLTNQTVNDTCGIFQELVDGMCGVCVEDECGQLWIIQAECPPSP